MRQDGLFPFSRIDNKGRYPEYRSGRQDDPATMASILKALSIQSTFVVGSETLPSAPLRQFSSNTYPKQFQKPHSNLSDGFRSSLPWAIKKSSCFQKVSFGRSSCRKTPS
jgi:hypothetical protein